MNRELEIRMLAAAGKWTDVGRAQTRYSEDQPRDDHGRFGEGSGSKSEAENIAKGLAGETAKEDAHGIKVGDTVTHGGKEYQVFGVQGNNLSVAQKYGPDSFGGTANLHADNVEKSGAVKTDGSNAGKPGASVANSSHFAVEFKVPKG